MLFVERPITVQHIWDFCRRFNEGLRVEYKSTFDQGVRDKLAKVICSFANSQGGALVIGVATEEGVPQEPFEGFIPPEREELALTVENICLQSIHPPLLPKTTLVPSDVGGRVFLVIEVDESGEAPHAIENSRKVYVRTGSAANPYDLADVDLIIDLMRRRKEPLELRERLLSQAEGRSIQVVQHVGPYLQVSICPAYPRTALCLSEDVWSFIVRVQNPLAYLIPYNSLRRVPDGVASLVSANPPQRAIPQYFELSKYGLAFATRPFALRRWDNANPSEHLVFGDLIHTALKLMICAERFYATNGYRGRALMRSSLHGVQGRSMRIRDADLFGDTPDEFRCYATEVHAERLIGAEQLADKLNLLTDILSELTWPFWQGQDEYPRASLENGLRNIVR